MNTKCSLLVILMMLFIPTTIIAIKVGKRPLVKETHYHLPAIKMDSEEAGKYLNDGPSPVTKPEVQKASVPSAEEDGKFHYFHFTRLRRKRFKRFLLFLSKLVLIIIHAATLALGYLHCLH